MKKLFIGNYFLCGKHKTPICSNPKYPSKGYKISNNLPKPILLKAIDKKQIKIE